MKTTIKFLFVLMFGTFNVIGQENNCADTKLYNIVFEELKFYERKAVDIQIGYMPSEFTINSISEINLFNEDEMEQFNKPINNIDYLSCAKFKRQIELILSDDLIKENGSYNSYRFSRVITFSNEKKCILKKTASKNKKYEGGKMVGSEVIYIFKKNEGKWNLINKKGILQY